MLFLWVLTTEKSFAFTHTAPVILKGKKVRPIANYPIRMYRLFKTDKNGAATPIPFQIDEINKWGDYVMASGPQPNQKTGNGRFDYLDELVFMGDDIGSRTDPKTFPGDLKPSILYKIDFDPPNNYSVKDAEPGSVFVGIYFSKAPEKSKKQYVVFDPYKSQVETSRYRYKFDKENHLIVRGVDTLKNAVAKPLINTSSFFMKADLKYFLTLRANHRSVNSELEAYKQGPVRAIVKVKFFYKFLKINFEIGMYTEVSFFANAVNLPAVMYNPINGRKSLNKGSGFYYGFAITQNPADYTIDTNLPKYKKEGMFDFLKAGKKIQPKYWFTAHDKGKMIHIEIAVSEELRKLGSAPMLYMENKSAAQISSRSNEDAKPLGESPVNLGLFFDLTKFKEGTHDINFKLYFENRYDEKDLEAFKRLDDWKIRLNRI